MGSPSDVFLPATVPSAISEHFRRQQSSGLSIRAYCEREEISVGLFYYWRRRYAKKSSVPLLSHPHDHGLASFVQLGSFALNRPRFEIRSQGGTTLSVYSEDMGAQEIAPLLMLLQGTERR